MFHGYSCVPIECLLSFVSPAAVARFVAAPVVNAIDRMLWCRPRPHVRKEIAKVRGPTLAHRNAAPTVLGIALVIRARTAILHVGPHFKLGRRPMFEAQGADNFAPEASAALRAPPECRGRNQGACATVTLAIPQRRIVSSPCPRRNYQPAKPLAHHFDQAHEKFLKRSHHKRKDKP